MKKLMIPAAVIAVGLLAFAFRPSEEAPVPAAASTEEGSLKWYTWEEAVAAVKKKPKKILVDVYTEWCGWCKRMDKTTFNHPEVAKYLSEHFYPVKFDAEQKKDIEWNGHTFKWVAGGRNGVHTLAYSLVDGRLSYPTVVYLTPQFERIMISPGYKGPEDMLKELRYAAEEHYKNKSWNDYLKGK